MTLIQVIDRARALLNEGLASTRSFPDDTSSFYKDTDLMGYVNNVQEELQNEIIQSFEDYFVTQTFLTISAGDPRYTLPTGCIKVRRVEDVRDAEDPTEIYPVTINNRNSSQFNNDLNTAIYQSGYYLEGNDIVLTNTPAFTDACAIQIHFIEALADLSTGSDISELPREHHGILVWGTVRQALFSEQADTTRADLEYARRFNKLIKYVENRQIQRPRSVRSIYGDAE